LDSINRWLIEGPAWIRYRVFLDLMKLTSDDNEIRSMKKEIFSNPAIMQIIKEVKDWEGDVLKRHNDANHPIHKLCFLADIGFSIEDPEIKGILESVLSHSSPEGPPQILSNYPTHFGGSGKDEWLWVLCDAPTSTYALIKMGYSEDARIINAVSYMKGLIREFGWPCAATNALEGFRGPGKNDDPCPYANLIMLKNLAALDPNTPNKEADIGIETLLSLWENSREQKPFLFKMGTDFRKIKVPFIWYDILHVTDVLSHYPQVWSDNRFLEMIKVIESKADENGRYKSESIWTKWKGWEFCQKREPSRWVTFCVLRMLSRNPNIN